MVDTAVSLRLRRLRASTGDALRSIKSKFKKSWRSVDAILASALLVAGLTLVAANYHPDVFVDIEAIVSEVELRTNRAGGGFGSSRALLNPEAKSREVLWRGIQIPTIQGGAELAENRHLAFRAKDPFEPVLELDHPASFIVKSVDEERFAILFHNAAGGAYRLYGQAIAQEGLEIDAAGVALPPAWQELAERGWTPVPENRSALRWQAVGIEPQIQVRTEVPPELRFIQTWMFDPSTAEPGFQQNTGIPFGAEPVALGSNLVFLQTSARPAVQEWSAFTDLPISEVRFWTERGAERLAHIRSGRITFPDGERPDIPLSGNSLLAISPRRDLRLNYLRPGPDGLEMHVSGVVTELRAGFGELRDMRPSSLQKAYSQGALTWAAMIVATILSGGVITARRDKDEDEAA